MQDVYNDFDSLSPAVESSLINPPFANSAGIFLLVLYLHQARFFHSGDIIDHRLQLNIE
jgi:hypothetical protein